MIARRAQKRRPVPRSKPKLDFSSVQHVTEVTVPGGKTYSLRDLESQYMQQVKGQGYTPARMQSDKLAKRRTFMKLALMVRMHEAGMTPEQIGEELGHHPKTIGTWLNGERSPQGISPKRHEYHMATRKPVAVNMEKPQELGYFLGTHTAKRMHFGRTKQSARYAKIVLNGVHETTGKFRESVDGAFGLKTREHTRMLRGSERPTRTIYLQSAELANRMSEMFAGKRGPWEALPDTPAARLGFARAFADFGSTHLVRTPQGDHIEFIHESPKVREVIARALRERGITFEQRSGKQGDHLRVPSGELPKFRREIGFRDPKRNAKLLEG